MLVVSVTPLDCAVAVVCDAAESHEWLSGPDKEKGHVYICILYYHQRSWAGLLPEAMLISVGELAPPITNPKH